MPSGIELYTQDRIISLFYYLPEDITLSSFKDCIVDIDSLTICPSFLHFSYCNDYGNIDECCYETQINIDEFKSIFLSDESLEGIKIYTKSINNHPNTIFFIISNNTLHKFVDIISNDNTKEISEDIFKKQKDLFINSNETLYKVNYTFPLSFLSDKVKSTLHLDNKSKKQSTSTSPENKKIRLTPAHKIYDRVLHDPTVDENLFTIGYLDRFTGIKEVLFTRFVTLDNEKFYNTSVPFHRIRYFKYIDTIVWNRDTRVNLIDGDKFRSLES